MSRRSLGQHYLVDYSVVRRMVSAANLNGTEAVIEIGTGRGALTKELAERSRRLDAFEIDRRNYAQTSKVVRGENVFLHLGDAFEVRPEFDVIISSLPYSRSQDFVEWISQARYDRGVVLLQRDFVTKILSPPGSREYRAVSAIAQISTDMTQGGDVGRESFQPPPRVDSVILSIRPRTQLTGDEIANIKRLFSLRRRRASQVLERLGFERADFGSRRVSSLTPAEVHEICRRTRTAERRPS